MANPTIKDVSKAAGVSVALVYAILNNSNGRIRASKEKALHVRDIAARLGYVPNSNARGLKLTRSFMIGILAYAIDTSFVPAILQGCEEFFLTSNYGMLLASYKDSKSLELNLETFKRRNVDGLIIIPGRKIKDPSIYKKFDNIPKVIIGANDSLPNSVCVYTNPESIAKIAIEQLVKRNHKNIAYLHNGRLDYWHKSLLANNLPINGNFEIQTVNTFEEGYKKSLLLFEENPQVTAVFADSDIVAAAACKAASSLNKKIAIIGTDDSLYCQMLSPQLSSIRVPKREHGSCAAEQLLLLLEGKEAKNIIFEPEFALRESVEV
jgi:LacI family transcriptional regulator